MDPIEELAVNPAKPARAEPRAAGVLLRIGAFAIDVFLVGLAAWAWDIAIWREEPLRAPYLGPLGAGLLAVVYYVWATARNYHTVGQGFAGLTLARTDYKPLTMRRAYWRMVLFVVTSGMILPNAVIMLFDKKRRTIHDWATKTWVYAVPDADPLRRKLAAAAGIFLIGLACARGLLALTDRLETRLSMQELAAGVDGGALSAPRSTETAAGLPFAAAASTEAARFSASAPEISTAAAAHAAALEAYGKLIESQRSAPEFAALRSDGSRGLDSFQCWGRPVLMYFLPADAKDGSAERLARLEERTDGGQLCLLTVPRPAPGQNLAASLAELLKNAPTLKAYVSLRLWPGPVPDAGPAVISYSRSGQLTTLTPDDLRDSKRLDALAARLLSDGTPEASVQMEDDAARSREEPELADSIELARSMHLMLESGDVDGLDGRARDLRETGQRNRNGDWMLAEYYGWLYGTDDSTRGPRISFLEQWIVKYPESTAPRVALGRLWLSYAYDGRGTAYSNLVTPQQWQLFRERLEKAHKYLYDARALKEKCPELYAALIDLATAENLPRDKTEALLQEGLAFEARYPRMYTAMKRYLLPQWHGEVGEWESFFASATAKNAGGEGAALYARLTVLASRDGPYGVGGSAIFRASKLSWPLARKGFIALLKADRDSRFTLNWFAFLACAADDAQTAAALFRRIGDDYVSEVWSNRVNYEHYRRWAAKSAPPPSKGRSARER